MNEKFVNDLHAEVDEVWLSLSLVRVWSKHSIAKEIGSEYRVNNFVPDHRSME